MVIADVLAGVPMTAAVAKQLLLLDLSQGLSCLS